jgi:hypothetical protein
LRVLLVRRDQPEKMALLEWQAKKGHPDLRARLDHLEPPDRLDRWAHQANPASNKTMLQTSFEVAPVGGLFYCFDVRSLNSREPLEAGIWGGRRRAVSASCTQLACAAS